jgi:hypothetical protein
MLREMFPGNCSETTRLLPSECLDDSSDAARTLRDLLPYIHVRGWCLTKMTGFPIPESRQRFCVIERFKLAH